MKLKMGEILRISGFCQSIKGYPLKIKVSYKVSKLMQTIEKDIEFYQKSFQKILEDYGQKDDKGQIIFTDDKSAIKLQEGKEQEGQVKVTELLALDVEISLEDLMFTYDELEDIQVTPEDMLVISKLIKE